MSRTIKVISRFAGGIADYTKESLVPDGFAFGRSIDYRTDPRSITLLPRTIKESGNTIVDLPKWAETQSGNTYIYGSAGNLYKRDTNASYTSLRTVPSSHGNGLSYFGEDDFLYYTSDSVIGRYGPLASASPQFADDFLGAQGGVPQNTNSLSLVAASSQYASRADTASLSITGDITLEAQVKPTSLPTAGNEMVLVSKWDESGATRSYKFGIAAVSGYFGDGSDGALTISADTTEAPIDSACSGTINTTTLTATNASFAAGQIILIHQTQGTGAGTWQRNKITGYTAGTISLDQPLNATYGTGAQVRVLKQYSSVTIDAGKTYSCKAWNGTVGGIIAFLCSGTLTVNGTLSARGTNAPVGTSVQNIQITGGGFRGGIFVNQNGDRIGAYTGESTLGNQQSLGSNAAYGNAGGGGYRNSNVTTSGSGGGGGNGAIGTQGSADASCSGGLGGGTVGTTDLTNMNPGGGGGGRIIGNTNQFFGNGASGGGIIFPTATTITLGGSGLITAHGGDSSPDGGGGGGGGSILLKAQNATLGTNQVIATGGASSAGPNNGGAGGDGRIHIDYLTSVTGTTSPTLNSTQDNTLVTNTTYQLKFGVSSTGSNSDLLTRNVNITTGVWQHVAVAWTSSTKTAEFYLNAVSQGTQVGTLTAIHDNASTFQIGMSKNGAGSAANFYDGLIDEVRVWASVRSASDLLAGSSTQIDPTTTGLKAYYRLNNDYLDSTTNANTLTASGSPTFSLSVPFSSPTTRLDIDQQATTSSQTYTLPTTISESATERKTFTPTKDPQKSIAVLVDTKGTGNWTLTVHDQYNNTITSATITNANLVVGYNEFIFATPWRPIINASYHFHLTSTVNDGKVTTGTVSDLETVSFRTYFSFLVTDTDFHPVAQMLNFLVVGNERYVAKYDATLWFPNHITLPAGFHVRCFAYWREYLAIGTWKGSSINNTEIGRIYFWDGISLTFNFFIDVPEGGINALFGSKGNLFVLAGYQGDLLDYSGGDNATKIKRLPKITADKYVEVYPGAITMWKTLLRFGIAGNSDSTDIQKGGYTWGSLNVRYPDSLSYDYPISTGTLTGTNLKIGLMTVVNRKLLIGWQDGTAFGIDNVDSSNAPYPTGTIEFLIDDDSVIWKQKEAVTLAGNFEPLIAGQGVTIKYKLDADTDWTSLPDVPSVGDNFSRFVIGGGRYNKYQVAADLATTTTSPTFLGISWEADQLQSEGRIG